MSRLGKLAIKIPSGTDIKIDSKSVKVKGPKGELKTDLLEVVKVEVVNDEIIVKVSNPEDKKEKSLWGLYRALINNMVVGVNSGYEKKLEVKGVGYKIAVVGNQINLNLGFSHPIEFPLPQGISATAEGNILTILGIDKQLVGEMAAQIRKLRKPEPYKGKGIRYIDEVIRRKAGKAAASK
ncbi:50S ribosomal protein L6 [Candidatus Falkowbacteria bacterium HGW-Falkowbacteria-1]|uniref:Large ribosomal subunit protein uL6 n=1 Tax=Candidatus Falkowbacteria bacterium HGW-Falkowbacteria-1 TaxID=2013768 RepID=A0A2N2E9A0_9BACT|nr:MAG: 50S ribosomal protein L6 [Candidatus Falkowbacteria bacterium HGW-Falkowbacteria-1]